MNRSDIQNPLLEVKIQKRWKMFELNMDFTAGGGILGILGASGSGKSMVLKSIAGIVMPDQGRIVLHGKERDTVLYDSLQHIRMRPQQRRVGYLFQNYALFPNMTVEQNIQIGIEGKKKGRIWQLPGSKQKKRQQDAGDWIRRFHLEGLEKRYPCQLSGGQQQRVALARVLAYEPEVLLLDEPFSAMDAYLREGLRLELAKVLKEFGGITILVTHDRDEAYQLCDHLLLMDQGNMLVSGRCKEIFQNPGTQMAARLTGCKNISRIRRLGSHRFLALDWGELELMTEKEIDESIDSVGLRAHDLQVVKEDELEGWKEDPKANLIPVGEAKVSEMPFEWYITLENGLWWKCKKEASTQEATGIVPGWLRAEPSSVLLLRR